MVNGQWIGWGLRPQPLVSDRLVASTTAIATAAITTSVSTGITAAVRWLVRILDIAAITAGHTLQHFAILVQAGNLDAGILQLVLYVHVRGKDDATNTDQSGLYVLQVLNCLTAHSESHGTQAWQWY